MSATDPGVLAQIFSFDPSAPSFRANPYPSYARVRESGAVTRSAFGLVSVATHRECATVLRDTRFGWGEALLVANHFMTDHDGSQVRQFIFMDPPDHTRVRSLVTKALAGTRVERLRSRAVEMVDEIVADVGVRAAAGPVDLMATVARPVPALLLGELMGVADDHLGLFQGWSASIAKGLDPDFMLTPEEIDERDSARARFNDYFGELAAERRVEPSNDLVSALVAAEQEGDTLTELELVTTCTLLLTAGYATTANQIGNGMLALLLHPDQLEVFRSRPDQVAPMVEELLRYDPPVQMISRSALADAEVGGVPVSVGEQLLLLLGAANRDPAVYPDPDRLDLNRRPERNLSFGLGIHFCVGAALARMASELAIGALAKLDLQLATDTPHHADSLVMRGLAELPVTIA
jgi:cytochrome P450